MQKKKHKVFQPHKLNKTEFKKAFSTSKSHTVFIIIELAYIGVDTADFPNNPADPSGFPHGFNVSSENLQIFDRSFDIKVQIIKHIYQKNFFFIRLYYLF